MRRKDQLYEVEIKSQALLNEGKKGFICYFKGGNRNTIVMNVQKLYPQFTKPEDNPVINITPIKYKEYERRKNGGDIEQKQKLLEREGNFV
jgi:hypothetical protein